MCDASASFILVSRLVQKSDSLNGVLDQVSETWAERMLMASTSELPYRDFFVRNKAYVFTIMNYYGATGNDALYTSLMKHPVFTAEHDFLCNKVVSKEEYSEQIERAGDQELSRYIELLAFCYTNRLINLLDARSLDEVKPDQNEFKELASLTRSLEARMMFDEIYLARHGVINAIGAERAVEMRGLETKKSYLQTAEKMMAELNTAPTYTT